MQTTFQSLIAAEEKAKLLLKKIEDLNLVQVGKSEKQLNKEIYNLAHDLLGIKKYWHKRIVRAGKNTLCPYKENPEDLIIRDSDIVFFDFGPVFEDWEADIGRTHVVGKNKAMLKLKNDVEEAWNEGLNFYLSHKETITGNEFYEYTQQLAVKYGWEYGNVHCGHLIGNFPHEKIQGEETINYIHPENIYPMQNQDKFRNNRYWIYEIHFVSHELQIGGFHEQLLTP